MGVHTLFDRLQKATPAAGVVAVRPGAAGLGSGVPVFGAAPTYPIPNMLPSKLPAPTVGQFKTPVIDMQDLSSIGMQVDVLRIAGQANLMNNVATPAGFNIEVSEDGNSFVKLTATSAPGVVNANNLTANTDGSLQQAPYNKPAYRYAQGRLVIVGAAAVMAAAVTAPAVLLQNGTALCVSPDGLVLFYGSSTSGFLQAFNITPATSAFSGAVNLGVAAAGAVAAIDVIGPFGGSLTYYVLVALGTTPYWAVYPYTVAGGFGAAITGTALAGAGLAAKFVRNLADPTKQMFFLGYTGAPGWIAYPFNANTGAVGAAATLTAAQNGGTMPTPGANVNGIDISLDGTMLVTAESTSPFMHLYTLNASADPTHPLTGVAPNPSVLPAAACVCCAFHPSGEVVTVATTSNLDSYPIYGNNGAFNGPPITAVATNPKAILMGRQQVKAGGLGNIAAIAYHPNGSALGVASATTPFYANFPVADFATAHLGTVETAPVAITNETAGKAVAWHPMGQYVYTAGTSSAAAGSAGGFPWLFDANVAFSFFGSSYQ